MCLLYHTYHLPLHQVRTQGGHVATNRPDRHIRHRGRGRGARDHQSGILCIKPTFFILLFVLNPPFYMGLLGDQEAAAQAPLSRGGHGMYTHIQS
jgi:hypothetical protein